MTDHGLEIGGVVDFDINSGGIAGSRESDRGTRGDAGEETASVPRRLPLEITPLINTVKARQIVQHTTSKMFCGVTGRTQARRATMASVPRIMINQRQVGEVSQKVSLGYILHSARATEKELLVVMREVSLTPCCRGPRPANHHLVGKWGRVMP